MIHDNQFKEVQKELEWKQKFQNIDSEMKIKQNLFVEKVMRPLSISSQVGEI